MSFLSPARRGISPRTGWIGAAALSVAALFGAQTAFTAPPPANAVIGNQASASYFDANGNAQLATSNLVQTTVQQVGSFTLDSVNQTTTTVINTKTGAAGNTVYAPHTVTNTGNGSDSFTVSVADTNNRFSKIEIYADANGDGVADSTTPLCSAVPSASCAAPAQTVEGNNGVFRFVIAYTIPGNATTPTAPYDSATITVTPGTPGLYTAPNTTAAALDEVNLTTVAAFSETKGIGIPAVAAPGGIAWPTALASGQRSSSGACPTTYAGMTPSASCRYTVYTINFTNTGGAAGKFATQDTLPAGFTYVTGSAVWSSAPGTALGDGAGGDPAGIDYQVTGNQVTAVVASIGPNVSQSVSFIVLVNNTAAIGTSTTTNTALYNPSAAGGGATAAAPGTFGASSNPAAFTVVPTYGIAIGTTPSTSATATDATPGSGDGTADLTTRPSVIAGGSVRFGQTVHNAGDAPDTVNLTVGTSSFPAGTTFLLFAGDGVSPLLDTNGDGVVDSGQIAAGGSRNIVVQATVPSSATVGSGPFSVRITGTSVGDTTKIDATNDTVTTVTGSLVDLTNTVAGTGAGTIGGGDLGPGPSPNATTTNTTTPGVGTIFTLFVKNNDTIGNTYTLRASQSTSFPGTLPNGWTVKFVAAGGGCGASAITTVTVATGVQTQVDACVTPSALQPPVTGQKIYFEVQSTAVASTGAIVTDAKTDAVTVITASSSSAILTPSNVGQVAPGGTVVYAHTLTNNGNQTCGSYTLTATVPSGDSTLGWTTVIYLDVNGDGQIDAGDTLVTGPIASLGAGGSSQKILVRVFSPGGATAGSTSQATVTATFAAACGAPSTTDLTTVISGQIRVNKTQAADADCNGVADTAFSAAALSMKPGQCMVYQVIATNQGSAPVTNLAINDAVPPYTSLNGTQPASQCSSTGVTGTAPAYASATSTVSCGSAANIVAPGGTATLSYAVRIDP